MRSARATLGRFGSLAFIALAVAIATGAAPTTVSADPLADGSASGSPADVAYRAYVARGEIVAQNDPAYVPLRDIATRIGPLVTKFFGSTPNYILVRSDAPDSFAVAGGDVFVTNSLMRFVENREELAGILCHETAHLTSGDAASASAQAQKTSTIVGVAGALLGANRTLLGLGGENAAVALTSANYSREQELSADAHGANLCAESGINPWGLVWLLQKFERSDAGGKLEVLADHPSETARIDALENLFRAEPARYGPFPIGIANATPLFPATTSRTF